MIAKTKLVKGQSDYRIPIDTCNLRVKVFNQKKNLWELRDFGIYIRINKILKTDKEIELVYDR